MLNLDAAVFGNPIGGDHDLCVFLEAGQYELTLVDPTLDKDVVPTLTTDQRVHFSIPDWVLLDSRSGVSIRVENVPEPSLPLLLASGLCMLRWLARRGPL